MALNFGNNTTDNVITGTGIADWGSTFSFIAAIRSTSNANNRHLFNRRTSAGARLAGSNASGDLLAQVARATTGATFVTNSAPLIQGQLQLVALTFDANATPSVHMYIGPIGGALSEPTYATSTSGSGGLTSVSGLALEIGNRTSAGSNQPFFGDIYWSIYSHAVLTFGDVLQIHKHGPFAPASQNQLICRYMFGQNGTSLQIDSSNYFNDGTVTGAKWAPTPDIVFRRHAPIKDVLAGTRRIYVAS